MGSWPGDNRLERLAIPDTQTATNPGQQAPRLQSRLAGHRLLSQAVSYPYLQETDKWNQGLTRFIWLSLLARSSSF